MKKTTKKKTPKRGRNAVKSGKSGEDIMEASTMPYMPVMSYREYIQLEHPRTHPIAVRHHPSAHPFRPHPGEKDREGENDFMLIANKNIFVQVKNQNGSGTTDEKLSFAFDIAHYTLTKTPFDRFMLVLLGTWWVDRPNIPEFCRRKALELSLITEAGGRRVEADVIVGPIELAKKLSKLHEEGEI